MIHFDDLPVHEFWVGADGEAIEVQIKDINGNNVDLSAMSSATISATLGGTYKIQAKTATIEAGTSGLVSYVPTAAEVNTDGDYKAQFRFVDGAAKVSYSQQMILRVRTPIHYTP